MRAVHMKISLSFFLAFLFCVTAPPAFSQTGSEALEKGREFYYQLDLAEAATQLRAALTSLTSDADRSEAYILLGMVALADGDRQGARKNFGEAITIDPSRKLSSKKYSPDIIRFYRQTRAAMVGAISVQTSPSDAQVTLNGVASGVTPVELEDLLVGRYIVIIQKGGYKKEEREIRVAASERSEFYLDLTVQDDQPPVVNLDSPHETNQGRSLRVRATVIDNQGVAEVRLHYRSTNGPTYRQIAMTQVEKGLYEGVIPPADVTPGGVELFVTAIDLGGNITEVGSAIKPHPVRVLEFDQEQPRIYHEPLIATSDATDLVIRASVTDNKRLASVRISYKTDEGGSFITEPMKNIAGTATYEAAIPEAFMKAKRIDYFIEALDTAGNVASSGSPTAPHDIFVERVIPFKQGFILDRKKERDGDLTDDVIINVGTRKGFQKGDVFNVFDATDRLVDPETGMVMGINQRLTGKIRITIPGPSSSTARITKEYESDAVRKGNLIRRKPGQIFGVGGYSAKYRQNTVTWSMSPEPDVKGYLVYRSASPSGPFERFAKSSHREKVSVLDRGGRKWKLVDGQRYYYVVRALNDLRQESEDSEVGFVVAKGGPNPPAELTARSGAIRAIELNWRASSDKEAINYTLSRADTPDGPWNAIATLRKKETHYIDKPDERKNHLLEDAKSYYYRLVSSNKAGKGGAPGATVSAATREKPKTPEGFTLLSTGVRQVSLAWSQSSDPDVKRYRIYRSDSATGTFELLKELSGRDKTEYLDKGTASRNGMKDGADYFYRLTAINVGGAESGPTPVVSGKTFGAPIGPTDVHAASGQVKRSTITWVPSVDPAVEGYTLYRATDETPMKKIKTMRGADKKSYRDSGSWGERLKDGTVYHYTVRSYNSVDVESQDPMVVTITTKFVPKIVTGLTATQFQAGSTTLTWAKSQEPDIKNYRILRSEKPEGKFPIIESKVTETEYKDTQLKNGATYYYRVQAIDRDGLISPESEIASARTKPAPVAPEGFEAMVAGEDVMLTWQSNPEPDIDHYIIYRLGFFGRKKIGESRQTSFPVVGGAKGENAYVITAVTRDGLQSAPSQKRP